MSEDEGGSVYNNEEKNIKYKNKNKKLTHETKALHVFGFALF